MLTLSAPLLEAETNYWAYRTQQ